MPWYMAEYNNEADHEWERFPTDEDAIAGFTGTDDNDALQAIYRCEDDECLTPLVCIWH